MKDQVDRYLNAVEHLPTAPTVMIKLITLFQRPGCDVDEIVGLLTVDPSLTAEVLRRCSSAFFGGEEAATDIFDAIMRLGFYEVYRTAIAMAGFKLFSVSKSGIIDVEELWRHSVSVAVVSGILAQELGESAGLAYTSGLLHDVGKILFAAVEGPRYAELIRQTGGSGAELDRLECEAFGFGHASIGARLLARWGVPLDVSTPVFCHHHSEWMEPYQRLSAAISLANDIAHQMDEPSEISESASAVFLGLSNEDLARLAQKAKEEIAGLAGLFNAAAAN